MHDGHRSTRYLAGTDTHRRLAAIVGGHAGKARIERDHAPTSIRSTREFADICPASSALMVKYL
jgi:hypothetical protein